MNEKESYFDRKFFEHLEGRREREEILNETVKVANQVRHIEEIQDKNL